MAKKRRRENRPSQQPSGRPRRSVESSKKSKDDVVGFTRRNIIIGGVSVAVLSLVGAEIFCDKDKPKKSDDTNTNENDRLVKVPPKDLFARPKLEGEMHEYEKWASKIELAQINIHPSQEWTTEQKQAHFFPLDLRRKKLKAFYNYFEDIMNYIQKNFTDSKTPEERKKIINKFLGSLVHGYYAAFKPEEAKGMINLNSLDIFKKINQVLIPYGYWVHHDHNKADGYRLVVYKTSDLLHLTASLGGKKTQLPVITLSRFQTLLADPKASKYSIRGNYWKKAKYITVEDMQSIDFRNMDKFNKLHKRPNKNVNRENLKASVFKATLKHEGEHVVMHRLRGIAYKKIAIGGKGPIHMGHYTLVENDYKWHTHQELHELAGLGRELMNHDPAILESRLRSILKSISLKHGHMKDSYHLASFIILYELAYVLDDAEHKKFVNTFMTKGANFGKLIISVPVEKLSKIGERMLKLAHHLAIK